MRKTLIVASLALASAALVGCTGQPVATRTVDQSVLPASAKAMFANDAQINSVEELTFTKGTKIYRVHYTVDGKNKVISVNPATETTPTGVFQHDVR